MALIGRSLITFLDGFIYTVDGYYTLTAGFSSCLRSLNSNNSLLSVHGCVAVSGLVAENSLVRCSRSIRIVKGIATFVWGRR